MSRRTTCVSRAIFCALFAASGAFGCSSSSVAAAGTSAANDAGSDSGPTAQTIPITMIAAASGNTFATVQVSVGGSAPFTALLDTGSLGLRVVDGFVADGEWNVTTSPVSGAFGSGLVASGVVANATVTVGGVLTNVLVAAEKITAVSCTSGQPDCRAKGQTASTFRFAGTFPAILGVGFRAESSGLGNVLAALGTQQQTIFSLPHFGGASGTLTIDPASSALAIFITPSVQLPASRTSAGSWDDTQVPFCANSFCANAILDTGASGSFNLTSAGDDASLGVPANSTSIPPGTAVTITIDKTASWSFTVGNPPVLGKDDFPLGASGQTNSLGITPFYQFDVLYDYSAGQIGFVAKP